MSTRAIAILFLCAFGVGAIVATAGPARAHGDAAWIAENARYVDRDNLHCCGTVDCHREHSTSFREAPEGVYVRTGTGDEVLMPRSLVGHGLYPSIDDD